MIIHMRESHSMNDYEVKYINSNIKAPIAKRWLDLNLLPDPKYPGTIISSVYFDTKDLKYLDEKIESDHIKSKFRIRWYESLDTRDASRVGFLEFKHKVGENRFKKRIEVDNTFFKKPLESIDFLGSLDELRLFNGNTLDHIQPSYIVSYTRFRYIVPNTDIRLCIDYNINVPRLNSRLLQGQIKKKYLSECVFELKGESAVLPSQLHYIEQLGFEKNSFSKYERCYEELIKRN